MNETPTRARLLMLVDNEVTHDSRVRRTAATAADAGLDVLVVGVSRSDGPWESREDGVRVVRVSLASGGSLAVRTLARAARRLARRPRSTPVERRGRAATVRRRAADGSLLPVLQGRLVERLAGHRAPGWRRIYPQFVLMAEAIDPIADRFAPDLVHVHDFPALPAGFRVRARAAARGRDVPVVYDAHEYVRGLDTFSPARRQACVEVEREHIAAAARVITVSPVTARLLERDHALERPPAVVLNAPARSRAAAPPERRLRAATGVGDDVALVVYAGVVTPARGLATVVDALPALAGVHLALITGERGPHLHALLARAERLGCSARVHVVPYVEPAQVSAFLTGASVGVSALVRYGNAEATLPNKLFEYLQARVPVVVSDHGAIRDLTVELGIGEPFTAGDPAAFARAVRRVLSERSRYVQAIDAPGVLERYSWETQAEVLVGVYAELLPAASVSPR